MRYLHMCAEHHMEDINNNRPLIPSKCGNSIWMELCLHKNLENLLSWLIFNKSGMGRDTGYCLFAGRYYKEYNIIIVYVGKKVNLHSADESRCFQVCQKFMDVEPNLYGVQPLYFRDHFSNFLNFSIADDDHEKFTRTNWFGKNKMPRYLELN